LLAALLVDCELVNDQPLAVDHCGSCRRCLDACPTQAFVAERVLDATKCISYLTIELKTQIPIELREGVGDWWFGCDVCQDVCPWNRFAPAPQDPDFHSHLNDFPADLAQLFFWDEAEFRRVFRHTPLWRAKRRGLLRNAAIVLGNQARESALPALTRALQDHEPLVRGAAAWALQKFPAALAATLLMRQRTAESDSDVAGEIDHSLAVLQAKS
jgi:epoxyqueuosine reductase